MPFSKPCVLHLDFKYCFPCRALWASQVASLIFTNSPTSKTPVVNDGWIHQIDLSSFVACYMVQSISFHNYGLSGLISRSQIRFGSLVSLSTLQLFCYRQSCKTRYVVELVSPSTTGLSPVRLVCLFLAHSPLPQKWFLF